MSDDRQVPIPDPPGFGDYSRDGGRDNTPGGQTNYDPKDIEAPFFESIDGVKSRVMVHKTPEYPPNWWIATKYLNLRQDVGTQPLEVLPALLPDAQGFGRKTVTLFNNSNNIIFLGGDFGPCTDTMGFPLLPNGTFTIDKEASGSIWAKSVAGSASASDLRIWVEMGYIAERIMNNVAPTGAN